MSKISYAEVVDSVMITLRLEVHKEQQAGLFPADHVQAAGLVAEGVANAFRGAIDGNAEAYKAGQIRAAVSAIRALAELEKAGL